MFVGLRNGRRVGSFGMRRYTVVVRERCLVMHEQREENVERVLCKLSLPRRINAINEMRLCWLFHVIKYLNPG